MEKISWETSFDGKLTVVLNGEGKIEVVPCGGAHLCVYAIQAIRMLMGKFLTGTGVMENWRIKRFSPQEGILEIETKKA